MTREDMEKVISQFAAAARRSLEAAKGGYDFMWIGEDLGTQKTPLISMELF